MRRVMAGLLVLGLLCCGQLWTRALVAQEARNAEDIEQELEELERQREELEREREEAERLEEQEEEFADIQARSAERLKDYEEWLEELEEVRDREEPPGPAEQERVEAEIAYVEARCAVDEKVCALEGVASLPDALKLLDDLEVLEAEYDMVTEPRLAMAAWREEAEQVAGEVGDADCQAILEELVEAQEGYLEVLQKQFELWKAARELEQRMEGLSDRFWDRVGEVQRARWEQEQEE